MTPLSQIQESVPVTSHQSPHQLALLSHPSIGGVGRGGTHPIDLLFLSLISTTLRHHNSHKLPVRCFSVRYADEAGIACAPRFKPINDSRRQIHFGGIWQLFLHMPYSSKDKQSTNAPCSSVATTIT